jgi:hypothetical protein
VVPTRDFSFDQAIPPEIVVVGDEVGPPEAAVSEACLTSSALSPEGAMYLI